MGERPDGRNPARKSGVATLVFILCLQMICRVVQGEETTSEQQQHGADLHSEVSSIGQLSAKNFCVHDDVATVCLACSAEPTGPSLAACCSEGHVFEVCSERLLLQVLGPDGAQEKRGVNLYARGRNKKFFLGKRSNAFDEDLLENEDEDGEFEEEEKRGRSPFLGKRRSPFLGKRRSPFLGKRDDMEKDEEKRGRSPFLGKRRMPFLG